jgi:hypothetical protein
MATPPAGPPVRAFRDNHLKPISRSSPATPTPTPPSPDEVAEAQKEKAKKKEDLPHLRKLLKAEQSVVKSRQGSVLTRGFILKNDNYASGTSEDLVLDLILSFFL